MYMALTHSQDGFTALMFAAQEGYADCLKALLEEGADKEAKDEVCPPVWKRDAHLTQLAGWGHTARACCIQGPPRLPQGAAGSWRGQGSEVSCASVLLGSAALV